MLAHRIAEGDKNARDRMVRASLRLVVNIARGYVGKGLAASGPDRGRQYRPAPRGRASTRAWELASAPTRVTGSSNRSSGPSVNTAKPIRIPAYMVELLFKWRRMASDLQDSPRSALRLSKRSPRPLTCPRRSWRLSRRRIKVYNLVPQTDQPENGWSLGEMLMDEADSAPDVEMVEADNLRLVMHRLGEMDKREATVLRMRFVANDAPPKTLKEIGESLGLTRERVRQIENEALGKLSATFAAD